MRANDLISRHNYETINNSRYELLNVIFNINEELPEEIGKAALVVYSDATSKSLATEWIEDVPVCHIRMLESDCYRIVANPDSQLLQFVEDSAIAVSSKQSVDFGHLLIADNISKGNTPNQSANLSESAENKEEVSGKLNIRQLFLWNRFYESTSLFYSEKGC